MKGWAAVGLLVNSDRQSPHWERWRGKFTFLRASMPSQEERRKVKLAEQWRVKGQVHKLTAWALIRRLRNPLLLPLPPRNESIKSNSATWKLSEILEKQANKKTCGSRLSCPSVICQREVVLGNDAFTALLIDLELILSLYQFQARLSSNITSCTNRLSLKLIRNWKWVATKEKFTSN